MRTLLWWIEPLFAASAAWLIWTLASLFSDPALGAYSGSALNGLLAGAWGVELVRGQRPRWRAVTLSGSPEHTQRADHGL